MCHISILMPVYNEENYIEESVNSIINQNFNDFELIIVDDGSSDKTLDKIQSIISNKIKIYNFGKIGKNAAINKAYELCNGNWITFFAGDDIMPEGALKLRAEAITKYDFEKKIVEYSQMKILSKDIRFNGLHLPKNKSRGISSGQTTLFSKGFANLIFPIPENYPNEDTWTDIHFNYFSDIKIHVPVTAVIYRVHDDNSMSRVNKFQIVNKKLHDRFSVYEYFYLKYKNDLSNIDLIRIKSMIEGENYRYIGNIFKISLLKNIAFKDKMRYIFHSNKILYSIKFNFSKLFIGW